MSESKKFSDDILGVACEVTNCKYNTIDCHCTANGIRVENNKANSKGETYCSTFTQRGCC